ncbi:MAG: S41 family peptidase, partial [Candidatus Syntrophonatronum acetioxidans]
MLKNLLNKEKGVLLRIIIPSLLCIFLVFSGGALTFAQEDLVKEIRQLLVNHYVEPLGPEVLEGETVEEILKALEDPHTTYFTPQEFQEFQEAMDPSFYGIGIYMEMVPQGVLVTGVIKGAPAEKAGILRGDIITEADGKELEGLALEEAGPIIAQAQEDPVPLKILREGEIMEFYVTREEIIIPNVKGELQDNNRGYIQINSFGTDVGELFEKEFFSLQEKGAEKWIIDLRHNMGGYMAGTLEILGNLLPGELVFTARNDNYNIRQMQRARQKEEVLEGPLILLVNQQSASASEVTAAALKDHGRALLLGEDTHGKGTIQGLYPLSAGGVLKMTVWELFTPGEEALEGVGVSPHLEIKDQYTLPVAQLLLGPVEEGHPLEIEGNPYHIDLEKSRDPEYWEAYGQLLRALEKETLWEHYYPGYQLISHLEEVPRDKVFEVSFNMPLDQETVSENTVKLVEKETGQRIDLEFISAREDL